MTAIDQWRTSMLIPYATPLVHGGERAIPSGTSNRRGVRQGRGVRAAGSARLGWANGMAGSLAWEEIRVEQDS